MRNGHLRHRLGRVAALLAEQRAVDALPVLSEEELATTVELDALLVELCLLRELALAVARERGQSVAGVDAAFEPLLVEALGAETLPGRVALREAERLVGEGLRAVLRLMVAWGVPWEERSRVLDRVTEAEGRALLVEALVRGGAA